jgi:UDP-sugar transporter A1/2/3
MANIVGRLVVFVVFIFLGVLIKLTQHWAKDIKFNPLCPMVVVSSGKLLLSLALYLINDGGIGQLVSQFRGAGKMIRNYSVVAGTYCMYDVLSFVNAALFDPQTFLVLLQFRVVTTAVVWEILFSKRNSWPKRFGLLLITIGCATKHAGGGSFHSTKSESSWRNWFMLLQIVANSFAGVANEMLLKQSGSLPLNAQNMVQYSWTIVWLFFAGFLAPVEGLRFDPLDFDNWEPMLDIRLWPSIAVLTVLGLVTALFLKLWDSNWKSVATSMELFFTGFASALVFGYPIRFTDLIALAIMIAGIWLFARPEGEAGQSILPMFLSRSRFGIKGWQAVDTEMKEAERIEAERINSTPVGKPAEGEDPEQECARPE